MSIKVLNAFKEKEHDNTVYQVGDTYPKGDFKADAKRVSFLQGNHPEYGVRFLDSVEDKPEKNTPAKTNAESKKTTDKKATTEKKSDAK